jgi:hypothetical protein
MWWKLTADEIKLVSNGAVFHAMIGWQSFDYRLTGSAEMLQMLGRCLCKGV